MGCAEIWGREDEKAFQAEETVQAKPCKSEATKCFGRMRMTQDRSWSLTGGRGEEGGLGPEGAPLAGLRSGACWLLLTGSPGPERWGRRCDPGLCLPQAGEGRGISQGD